MANGRPPWTDYRALITGHLIGLYKCPEERPVLDSGNVHAGGDGGIGQGGLRDGANLHWDGGRDRRGDLQGAAPVAEACPVGGLGFLLIYTRNDFN